MRAEGLRIRPQLGLALLCIAGVGVCFVLAYGFATQPTATAIVGLSVGLGLLLADRADIALAGALATIPLARQVVPIGLVPVSELACAGAVIIAAIQLLARPVAGSRLVLAPRWLTISFASLATLALASLLLAGNDSVVELRRFGHLMIGLALVWVIARGILPLRMAGLALLAGLYLSGTAGLLGIAEDAGYSGRLTGLFGDPNVAAFGFAVLGAIALSSISSTRGRIIAVLPLLLFVGLAMSRTGFVAVGVMTVWIALSNSRRVPISALAVGVLIAVIALGSTQVDIGDPFSDRAGSDALRQEIYEASEHRAFDAPLLGHGPAPQKVVARDESWFFHNSYYAAASELGIIFALGWLATLAAAFITLYRSRPRNVLLEATLLGVAVIAFSLGEVLLELPTMVALGFAVAYAQRSKLRARQNQHRHPTHAVGAM